MKKLLKRESERESGNHGLSLDLLLEKVINVQRNKNTDVSMEWRHLGYRDRCHAKSAAYKV